MPTTIDRERSSELQGFDSRSNGRIRCAGIDRRGGVVEDGRSRSKLEKQGRSKQEQDSQIPFRSALGPPHLHRQIKPVVWKSYHCKHHDFSDQDHIALSETSSTSSSASGQSNCPNSTSISGNDGHRPTSSCPPTAIPRRKWPRSVQLVSRLGSRHHSLGLGRITSTSTGQLHDQDRSGQGPRC